MRAFLTLAVGFTAISMFGAVAAFADTCREDLHACVSSSKGHPHICDPLVRNMPMCEANERKGIQQSDVDPKFTKEAIFRLYSMK